MENVRDSRVLLLINPVSNFLMKFRDPKIYLVEIHRKDPSRTKSSPFEYLYEYSLKDGWWNGTKEKQFAKKMCLSEASMFISSYSKMYPEFFHIILIDSFKVPMELGKDHTVVLQSSMNEVE